MNRMKVFIWMAAIFLFAAFASCSDDKSDGTDDSVEAKLLTFGFYAEDNSDVLSEDYIVASLSSATVQIAMPAFVNKSSLVARFTTNDGNIVLIDGVTQISGATCNDFNVPVDYIVSNGKQNVKYTITITKSSDMVWKELTKFADTEVYGGAVMKLNPVNNMPYLAFKHRKAEVVDNKMAVVKFEDGIWKPLGALSGFSDGEVGSSYLDMDFDTKGVPYAVFSDNSIVAATDAVKGAASMMKWNGTGWSYVGNKGLILAQSQNIHFAMLNETPMVIQKNNRAGAFERRELLVSTYNNGWTNGTVTSAGAQYTISDCNLASSGEDAYVIAVSSTNSMYSVHKYTNGQWKAILTESMEAGATHTYANGVKIAVSETGIVYTLTGDDAVTAGVYQGRLKKYDPSTSQWSTVGGNPLPLGFNLSSSTSIAIAVAPDGTPFVTYRDEGDQDYPKVIYLDNETKQWSTPIKLASVKSDDMNIVFSSTGVGYISFVDPENHVIVYKYAEK